MDSYIQPRDGRGGSMCAACQSVSPKVGVGAESLRRRWVYQAKVGAAQRPGATTAEQQHINYLE